jgi:hypothetical protein
MTSDRDNQFQAGQAPVAVTMLRDHKTLGGVLAHVGLRSALATEVAVFDASGQIEISPSRPQDRSNVGSQQ